ncbi:MAG TPA: hypothetical protein GXZ47_10165 [Treponema sp.]|nr:hypothetical protein [Treponema sp.]
MKNGVESDLSRIFNPSYKSAMVEECMKISESFLGKEEQREVRHRWDLITDLFYGSFHGYQACNTEYHDFNHTCDVFCATVRMYDGAYSQGFILDNDLLLDTFTASMLHDAGYIQEVEDTKGTGAKHTKTHVTRSIAFTKKNQNVFHLSPTNSTRIGRIISGTDLAIPFNTIPFESDHERWAAELLASADLVGQMADRTYLEKLLFLYYEFREAGFPGYDTEFDILRKTLGFYESTKIRLFDTLGNATRFAQDHFASRYGINKNLYLESIQRQIDYLQGIIEDSTANFRKKLKRLDLENVSKTHQHLETHA